MKNTVRHSEPQQDENGIGIDSNHENCSENGIEKIQNTISFMDDGWTSYHPRKFNTAKTGSEDLNRSDIEVRL